MSSTIQSVTADELLEMPSDGFRYELVKGELRKMAPAGDEHGKVAMNFGWRLAQHVTTNNLGTVYAAETGFLLSSNPDTVRAPDVAFVRRKRIEEAGKVKGYRPGAPDLAVEVISPGDSRAKVDEKVAEWLNAGASMALVLNPRKRTVAICSSLNDIRIIGDDDVLDLSEVVEGFRIPVKDIFD